LTLSKLLRFDRNLDAAHALENLKASGATYLLVTTHTGAANMELNATGFRPLDLCAAPFSLGQPLLMMRDYRDDAPDSLQSYLAVWKVG
jgi:hypothetical protein